MSWKYHKNSTDLQPLRLSKTYVTPPLTSIWQMLLSYLPPDAISSHNGDISSIIVGVWLIVS